MNLVPFFLRTHIQSINKEHLHKFLQQILQQYLFYILYMGIIWFIIVHAACSIRQDGSILTNRGLITLIARELPFDAIRQSPTVCQRMSLVGCEHPFVDSLLAAACAKALMKANRVNANVIQVFLVIGGHNINCRFYNISQSCKCAAWNPGRS